MLVLSRKTGESVQIGNEIVVRIESIRPGEVCIEITAPFSLKRLLLPAETMIPADQKVVRCKRNESLAIGDDIHITVVEIRGDKVRLGIDYPRGLQVHRLD